MRGIDLKNPLVLVVEDYEDTRHFMRLALEGRGYRVCEAANGEQAIAVAGRERPNAILMDISMPVLNGLTATARIRQNSALQKIPIVALTAHREADLRDGAQACGFTAYVTKPIDFEWLDDLIRRLLD
jgi:two-component system cell cycle response regulator DivK